MIRPRRRSASPLQVIPRTLSALALLVALSPTSTAAPGLTLHTLRREPSTRGPAPGFEARERTVSWDPKGTALVICDMWDRHWCPDATARVGEMAPVMNRVVSAARAKGVLVIHCPSDTLDFYKDHPGRRLASAAPKVETDVPLQRWCALNREKEAPLPIDDSDGGCDGCPDCKSSRAWSRQHPAIEIAPGDAITDSAEAYYLMRQRGITNVMVMGVHANMCVLGRPFSIRQMVAQGQNVVLVRDLTDAMYNHRKAPFVSHFRGTELVVEHIERYWCPSIVSTDLTGEPPFRFNGDRRRTVVLITGENEYGTEATLPAFFEQALRWRGYRVATVAAPVREGDGQFQNAEAIRDADLLVLSVRRRTPPKPMLDLLRAHVAARKPVVGIRTASHAFDATPSDPGHVAWPAFDDEVLGADYQGHYGNKPPAAPHTWVTPVTAVRAHPILSGVQTDGFRSTSHLYKYRRLAPTVVPLLSGVVEGRSDTEPVAWANTAEGRRVFYTSLGNREDFDLPVFQRLLLNGILWALDDLVPPAEASVADPRPGPR